MSRKKNYCQNSSLVSGGASDPVAWGLLFAQWACVSPPDVPRLVCARGMQGLTGYLPPLPPWNPWTEQLRVWGLVTGCTPCGFAQVFFFLGHCTRGTVMSSGLTFDLKLGLRIWFIEFKTTVFWKTLWKAGWQEGAQSPGLGGKLGHCWSSPGCQFSFPSCERPQSLPAPSPHLSRGLSLHPSGGWLGASGSFCRYLLMKHR